MSDESPMYNGSEQEFAEHKTVNYKSGQYVDCDAHVSTS